MLQECTPVYLFLKTGASVFNPARFEGKKDGWGEIQAEGPISTKVPKQNPGIINMFPICITILTISTKPCLFLLPRWLRLCINK